MKKEREQHILNQKAWVDVYHREKYKTALVYFENFDHQNQYLKKDLIWNQYVDTRFFQTVTKVNYITSCLWLQWRNLKVNDGRKGFVKLPDKPNWLVLVRNFKRQQERRIKVLAYLEERKNRKSNTNLKPIDNGSESNKSRQGATAPNFLQ